MTIALEGNSPPARVCAGGQSYPSDRFIRALRAPNLRIIGFQLRAVSEAGRDHQGEYRPAGTVCPKRRPPPPVGDIVDLIEAREPREDPDSRLR
jgi:hypothetical protein